MSSCNCSKESNYISTDVVFTTMEILADQITSTASVINKENVADMLKLLLKAREKKACVFIAGAGRSGLMGKSFAMRLMHMGFNAYVVGETVTPSVQKGDVMIAISGSGTTASVLANGQKCTDIGAYLIAITSKAGSKLGDLSDVNVVLPAKSKDDSSGSPASKTPMGTSFEILTLVFLDSMIMQLIELTGVSEDEMKARHANME